MVELRVAVVGGAPLIQAGMAAVLAQDPRIAVVLQAPDVSGALEGLGRRPCDVVVLNTDAPRADVAALRGGLAVHEAHGTPTRILALTDSDRPDEALGVLRGGAQGFGVRRQLWPEDVCAGVLAVGRGLPWACPVVTRYLIDRAARGPRTGEPAPGGLSLRELDVLRLGAAGAADDRIARELSLSPNSVKTYWQRIRVKLGANSRREAIRHAVTRALVPDRRLAAAVA